MVEPLPKKVLDTAVDPAKIAQQSFDPARRGFDQRQVQQYLVAVADSLHDAQQREADMRTRMGRAIRRAEAAEATLRNAPALNEAELTRQVGDEVTSVLEAARIASEQRVAEAEQAAEQILSQAHTEAHTLRAAADALMAKRTDAADAAAVEIVGEGHAEAQVLRAESRASADAMVSQAADRVERARNECDALIHEAEEARAQILEDMERRRRQARAQVERLRVGRDRLLRSYEVVRRTLEETTVELKSSLKEAKVRGDGAARAINSEPLANRDQLEAELRDAKMIGRITISDVGPPSSSPITHSEATMAPRSPALPRPLDPPQTSAAPPDDAQSETHGGATSPPTPRRPRVSDAMKRASLPTQPKAPAVAPALTARIATEADEELAKDPIAAMMHAAEARRAGTAAPVSADLDDSDEPIDPELADLEDDDLDVIEASDEIEEVVAMPLESAGAGSTPGLFAALREQRSSKAAKKSEAAKSKAAKSKAAKSKTAAPKTAAPNTAAPNTAAPNTAAPTTAAPKSAKSGAAKSGAAKSGTARSKAAASETEPTLRKVEQAAKVAATSKITPPQIDVAQIDEAGQTASESAMPGIEAQRDAVIADAAKQLEKRLKRALADEQNDLLAGIRAAKRNKVVLTTIVGDVDTHVNRYVLAIHEVAAVTYGAGAALIDVEVSGGMLPAGAVEELLANDVVLPIRERLLSLDGLKINGADEHIDPVRAFYRQRKTDHLGMAASRLASLLCVAGLCDSLPEDAALPWPAPTKTTRAT